MAAAAMSNMIATRVIGAELDLYNRAHCGDSVIGIKPADLITDNGCVRIYAKEFWALYFNNLYKSMYDYTVLRIEPLGGCRQMVRDTTAVFAACDALPLTHAHILGTVWRLTKQLHMSLRRTMLSSRGACPPADLYRELLTAEVNFHMEGINRVLRAELLRECNGPKELQRLAPGADFISHRPSRSARHSYPNSHN
jgi:hypothetical protein